MLAARLLETPNGRAVGRLCEPAGLGWIGELRGGRELCGGGRIGALAIARPRRWLDTARSLLGTSCMKPSETMIPVTSAVSPISVIRNLTVAPHAAAVFPSPHASKSRFHPV